MKHGENGLESIGYEWGESTQYAARIVQRYGLVSFLREVGTSQPKQVRRLL